MERERERERESARERKREKERKSTFKEMRILINDSSLCGVKVMLQISGKEKLGNSF